MAAAPAVEDQFADIDCSITQETTIGMKVCAGRELDKSEKALKAKRQELLKASDKEGRRILAKWFKASDAYAQAGCEVERDRFRGGSISGLVYGTCLDGEFQRQFKELEEIQNRPEGQ